MRACLRALAFGVSAAALALSEAPVAAQPQGGNPPPQPEWLRNATPEQRERIGEDFDRMVDPAIRRVREDTPNLVNTVRGRVERMRAGYDEVAPALDPRINGGRSPEEIMADPNYARRLAQGGINGVQQYVGAAQDISQTLNPAARSIVDNSPAVLRTMREVAVENGASPAEIAEIDAAIREGQTQVGLRVDRNTARQDYEINDFQRRLRENQQQIEDDVTRAYEETIRQYGPNPRNWPSGTQRRILADNLPPVPDLPLLPSDIPGTTDLRREAAQSTGGLLGGDAAESGPATGPGASAGARLNGPGTQTGSTGPAGPASSSGISGATGTAARGTVRRGTGAGTQGSLSDGPRVPRSQGGTGEETAESRQAMEQRASQQAQQRAEAQAERTERLRQAAMARAREDNVGTGQRAPRNQPAPAPGSRAARANELGTPDPEGRSPPPRRAANDDVGRAVQAAIESLSGAAAASQVQGRGQPGDGTRRGTQGETPIQYRRRMFGLGRVGGGQTGGEGYGDGGIIDLALELGQQSPDAAAAAERARREAERLANERARLAATAQARVAQDARWNALVRDRFGDGAWEAFENNGGTLTTLQLEDIYRNYNPLNAIPPAMSLSSAPNSLSAVGRSLSAAGTPVRSGTDDYNDPAVQSLYEALYGLTQRRGPYAPRETEIQTANLGDFDLYTDPTGRWGQESGGYIAASLFSEELDYLQRSFVNGRNGLQGLLAQPFNVLLTWGTGAFDLDLHLTGPTGTGNTDRFHIYYAAVGNLQSFPFAQLIRDCICSAGSEVILTSNLLGGGVYRVSVFNFGDQSANSNNLSNQSNARIQIVRGGVAVAQGNGTTIQGGRLILDTVVPVGQPGNTWVAVELDPRNGRITVPRTIVQSNGSANVR